MCGAYVYMHMHICERMYMCIHICAWDMLESEPWFEVC